MSGAQEAADRPRSSSVSVSHAVALPRHDHLRRRRWRRRWSRPRDHTDTPDGLYHPHAAARPPVSVECARVIPKRNFEVSQIHPWCDGYRVNRLVSLDWVSLQCTE
jgi:hypothetical protein